jgi:hypothetical protein
MAQIRVSILDPSNTRKTQVEVPDSVPADRLIRALVTRMGLDRQDRGGQPITYRFGYSRNGQDAEVLPEQTLAHAGIQNDDTLRVYANIQAGCFLPGTKISLANGSTLPIESLHPGAQILSYDTGSQKLCIGVVQEKTTTNTSHYLVINDLLRITPSHLVYVESQWQPAGNLAAGQHLSSETGRPWRIDSITKIADRAVVHNLHLSNREHTFFADGLLVHNMAEKAAWNQSHTPATSLRLTSGDRQMLVDEIIDAFEARTLVKIINQIGTTRQEREKAHGTVLAKPIFGLPHEDGQYQCDAFMIMPFSPQFQSIYQDYIKPVIESCSLRISRADDFFTNKTIIEDLWSALARARLIIADCTGRNANVFYELGIAHTLGKPTILLAQTLSDLPFDIQGRRAIVYEDRSQGLKLLQGRLREAVVALLAAEQV